jgi:hypothetical protein
MMNGTINELQSHPLVPFHPAHTHTHTHTPHSFPIMVYCYYVLLCTAGHSWCTTYKNKHRRIHKTKITTSSIAKDFHRKSTYNHDHTTAITSQLPLSAGLSGHTHPGLDRCWPLITISTTSRWCVNTGCDSLTQSYSHGDAPADITPG